MLNNVSLIGRLTGDAWGWRKGSVEFTRFTLATSTGATDPIEPPQADAVRVGVVAYGALARLLRGLRAGYQIAVTGQLCNAPISDLDRDDLPRLQVLARDVDYLRFQRPARG